MVSHQSGSFVLRDSTLSTGLVDTSLQLTLFAFIGAGNQILQGPRRRGGHPAAFCCSRAAPGRPRLCRRSERTPLRLLAAHARQRRRQREPLDSRQAPTASTACAAVARGPPLQRLEAVLTTLLKNWRAAHGGLSVTRVVAVRI